MSFNYQKMLYSAALLAVVLCSGCAGKRGFVPEPIAVAPPRIDASSALANDEVRSYGVAPVAFRTGVQARQCASSS
jgi:hypothetical protein